MCVDMLHAFRSRAYLDLFVSGDRIVAKQRETTEKMTVRFAVIVGDHRAGNRAKMCPEWVNATETED